MVCHETYKDKNGQMAAVPEEIISDNNGKQFYKKDNFSMKK